ncbi:hypothetical protein F5Y17DRAFT_470250 [Xylariaceae sp. FL0594]|nr:hypothetical protein F5Y17DRAFT_470250 [Xylariaceae sp. FL0594]
MDTKGKRKRNVSEGAQLASAKRSKGGNQGRWMTPSHKAKLAAVKGRALEVGDAGFWITCQRQKEMRAADEILSICDEYGQRLFGMDAGVGGNDGGGGHDGGSGAAGQEPEDIEAAIEKEIAALKPANKPKGGSFDLLRMNVDCVLFMRTRPPVDSLRLVHEICRDASIAAERSQWRSRFINKLTPISYTAKATEKGLEELVEKILPEHFQLAKNEEEPAAVDEGGACSYAIRPTIRAHTTLNRSQVIDKVAKMISTRHKVDLKTPDKVIIIEIFQTFCGMSVVGRDWEAMKKYNIHELYSLASKRGFGLGGPEKSSIEAEGEKANEEEGYKGAEQTVE